MNMNTNYGKPSTNFFAGFWQLKKALEFGYNARLVRARNEDCAHPILTKQHDEDFRNYEFSYGSIKTVNDIAGDESKSGFERYLSLNFKACYGSEEAVKRYYETGELSEDNFRGIGRCHLVNVDDMIRFHKIYPHQDKNKTAALLIKKYRTDSTRGNGYFFDTFKYKFISPWKVKKFKKKVWVIELLKDTGDTRIPKAIQFLILLTYPIKFFPERRVLNMGEYKNVKYTIGKGKECNSFSIEFNIPKKFKLK